MQIEEDNNRIKELLRNALNNQNNEHVKIIYDHNNSVKL
jgi:hypothetical protein